jgi:ATP-dependent protease ClpP protease subunit
MDILINSAIGQELGEISAAEIKRQLSRAAGQPIVVRIHSEGGSVFEGLAIHDAFKSYAGKKKCIIESCALSMASAVAMAFDDIEITPNGWLMVHNPSFESNEDSEHPLLEKLRTRLVDLYASGTRLAKRTVEAMMQSETFLDSAEALRLGFVSRIQSGTSPRAVAQDQSMLHRSPKFRACIVARLGTATTPTTWKDAVRSQMAKGLSASKAMLVVDKEHPQLRQQFIREANKR